MSKREDMLKSYMTDNEKRDYDEYEKRMKAIRDRATKSQRAEMDFWKQIDRREEEVLQHITKRRAVREAEETAERQEEPVRQVQVPLVPVRQPLREDMQPVQARQDCGAGMQTGTAKPEQQSKKLTPPTQR